MYLTPPLDSQSRLVMRNAGRHAELLGHDWLTPDHILLGILDEGTGVTESILNQIDRQFSVIRENLYCRMPKADAPRIAKTPRSNPATQLLEHAAYEALQADCRSVSPPYLIIGMLRVRGTNAYETLNEIGVKIEAVRLDVSRLRPQEE